MSVKQRSCEYQFYSHWFDPTWNQKPKSTAAPDCPEADALTIRSSELYYYAKSYNANACTEMQVKELENYIKRAELPKLSEDQKLFCDALNTLHECKTALNQLRTNKSSGLDGFYIEFYKAFWDDLKQYFLDSINFSASTSALTKTQYRGVITLIPKPRKEHSFPCN